MKTAIIIGVGPGLGLSLARAFGQEGLHVALVARSEANLTSYQQILEAEGISSSSHAADISDFSAFRIRWKSLFIMPSKDNSTHLSNLMWSK